MEERKSQADKFREAAKELETDNDAKRFDEKLRRIATDKLPSVPTGYKRDESCDQED